MKERDIFGIILVIIEFVLVCVGSKMLHVDFNSCLLMALFVDYFYVKGRKLWDEGK